MMLWLEYAISRTDIGCTFGASSEARFSGLTRRFAASKSRRSRFIIARLTPLATIKTSITTAMIGALIAEPIRILFVSSVSLACRNYGFRIRGFRRTRNLDNHPNISQRQCGLGQVSILPPFQTYGVYTFFQFTGP